jgi:hypothetical protein
VVKFILRLEGLTIFLAAIYIYSLMEGNWLFFIIFILIPDISMLGYIGNGKIGALVYNIFHNLTLPLLLTVLGFFFNIEILAFAGVILLAHVGMDRLFGFGLKYESGFKDTHLQRV